MRAKHRKQRYGPFDVLARPGVVFSARDRQRIRACQESGRLADAQRIILNRLSAEFDGPSFRVTMRDGRKRLVPRSQEYVK